jgi:hypothetical protein
MKVNKYLPHLLVLPEDDANRQLANGFLLDPSLSDQNIDVLDVAGGWRKVLETFRSQHIREMDVYRNRFMVLLIDFDGQRERLGMAKADVPPHLNDRVFILGVLTEPERLRASLGTYETIGRAVAKDCHHGTDATWDHPLLQHNASEVERLRRHVRPILFPSVSSR